MLTESIRELQTAFVEPVGFVALLGDAVEAFAKKLREAAIDAELPMPVHPIPDLCLATPSGMPLRLKPHNALVVGNRHETSLRTHKRDKGGDLHAPAAIARMEEAQQVDIALQTKTLGVDATFEVVVVPTLEVDDGGMVAHEVSAQPVVSVDIALADAERDFSPLQCALE